MLPANIPFLLRTRLWISKHLLMREKVCETRPKPVLFAIINLQTMKQYIWPRLCGTKTVLCAHIVPELSININNYEWKNCKAGASDPDRRVAGNWSLAYRQETNIPEWQGISRVG